LTWKLSIFQVLFGSAIFTFAALIGGAFFVFFASGRIVITAVSIPINLRSILFLQALSRSGAATGSLILSNRLGAEDAAFKWLSQKVEEKN
jgi:hypothetical protein